MSFGRFFSDVQEFHREMGFFPFADLKLDAKVEYKGETLTFAEAVMRKRRDIVREECSEFCEALAEGDKSKILHEAIDVVYVVLGGLVESGVTWAELSAGWALVQIANLGKDKPDSPLSKAVKGERFEPADVSKAIGAEAEVHTYAAVYGWGDSAQTTLFSTFGPLDKSDWLALVNDSMSKTGMLPSSVVPLL